MGRLPRSVDDGLIGHALNRGNNRADVFTDDHDHAGFRDALANTQQRYPFRLFGYCVMTNHFHLLLGPEPKQLSTDPNLYAVSEPERLRAPTVV